MSDAGEPPRKTPPTTTADRDDKQSAAGISDSQEFRHEQRRPQATTSGATGTTQPPQPHELTAEWTVRAQLTFARAGEKVQREFSSNDPTNPVRVVYKWSTFDSPVPPDDDVDIDDSSSSTLHKRNSFASRGSRQSTPLKTAQHTRRWHQQPHESFRSTTSSTNADLGGGDSAFSGSNASKQRQRPYQRQPQTASGGPNVAGVATGALYGTRCRSTCNIVVSAVADFLPADAASSAAFASAANEDFASSGAGGGGGGRGRATTHVTATATDFIPEKEADPFVFNTTASYTVLPQRSIDSTISTGSKDFAALGKVLALRDAFSQTSDTETKYFEEREREYERRRFANSRSPIDRRTVQQQQQQSQKERKSYEQRRATAEGLLQAPSSHLSGDSYVDEAHSFMPSFLTSPSHTFKSASMSRIPTVPEQTRYQQQQHALASKQKSSSSEPLKKPRTVHIDVYCTGSEDEEEEGEGEDENDHADADAEASASSNASNDDDEDASKHHDLESTSTPQTVFDNEQLLLKHKRITGQTLPRRLQKPPPSAEPVAPPHTQQSQNVADLHLGHAITKSSTAEEVSESKQLLFRKHIGDQRAAKLAALRQKYMRQPSDDAISSNYPNSSRSTVRDATCSSIASSVVTSSQAEYGADSSWKEAEDQEEMYSLAKSDSFEYENTTDRLRIKQMECFWSRTSSTEEPPSGQRQTLAGSPVRGHMQSPFLQPISEVSSQGNSPFATPVSRHDTLPTESENFSETSDIYYTYPGASGVRTSPAYLQQTSHFPRNRPGFLQFFGPSTSPSLPQQRHASLQSPSHEMPATTTAADVVVSPPHAQLLYADYQPRLQRWKSETRDNLSTHGTSSPADRSSCASPLAVAGEISPLFQKSGSEAPPTTTSAATFHQSPMIARRFEMKHASPAVSEASTTYAGYTVEHLQKAKKFGAVVSTARKPGHHVGPTKNPNCSCESCQRWLAERFQVRSRAFSLGERPILRRASKGNI
ncbi:uncharacterized protein LOC128868367 [Anastrepha ludens]|uniref:uncharacterized protein LOC128868367 n=1 Tax=Anastrepha ludens TaxID=28586 RepID=UPI0023AFEBF8|nr:uncharacterized protein LOC128868367 [Anastrepha ludens]XP_053966354.1 uncharacterized protein LOC128868367 [Anastrepha ludens]